MSTHNLCFRAKIRKNEHLCTPQFYYTKVRCKGVLVTRTCFRNEVFMLLLFEPSCEKTGLRGFRPGRTQTGLYSYRR